MPLHGTFLNWPVILSSSLASFVEMVEALTIVIAAATVRGWRSAWAGALPAFAVLTALVLVGGPALTRIDLRPLQLIIGVLLLLFGMRWLRKAILRAAGRIPMHDETEIYEHEVVLLQGRPVHAWHGIDIGAAAAAFNGVLIEGIEVVFIVIAVGSTAGRLQSAAIGAVMALAAVVLLGLALRAPLSKIPENALKMVVGVMLTTLGTIWTGEGIGLSWTLGDWSIAVTACVYAVAAGILVALAKRQHQLTKTSARF